MIGDADRRGESPGRPVWCCDEAGPFQTVPHPGAAWRPEGEPARQAHEYVRTGTAKVLTPFHPGSGRVEVDGATSCTNAVLHAWLERGLSQVLAALPVPAPVPPGESCRASRERWQEGPTWPITLPANPPPLRVLLVLDNPAGHRTPEFVCWLFAQGVMPLYSGLRETEPPRRDRRGGRDPLASGRGVTAVTAGQVKPAPAARGRGGGPPARPAGCGRGGGWARGGGRPPAGRARPGGRRDRSRRGPRVR